MAEIKQIPIEQRFLKEFIQKLIMSRAVLKDVENQLKIESGIIPMPQEKRIDKEAIRRYLQSRNSQLNSRFNLQPKPVQLPAKDDSFRKIERIPVVAPTKIIEQPAAPPGINLSSYEKVIAFLKDPTIISIESPGPEKPLLVNRSGAIQTTNMILTKEDIDDIVKEVSRKTKIPLLRGVFKAAFGEYLITAVISEYVGTRFTIQKKPVFNN